jgi:hypothetical protein
MFFVLIATLPLLMSAQMEKASIKNRSRASTMSGIVPIQIVRITEELGSIVTETQNGRGGRNKMNFIDCCDVKSELSCISYEKLKVLARENPATMVKVILDEAKFIASSKDALCLVNMVDFKALDFEAV